MASTAVIAVGVVTTYVFLRLLLSYTHDEKEPPAIATEIPFLGPIIGMGKKSKFYTDLRDKYNLPIYTLRLPGSRIYVVNSTSLIPVVQRQVRVLDFAPIEARAAINVMGATPEGKAILNTNRNGVGDHSYAIEFDKAIHHAVTPGAPLDAMNRLSVQKVSSFLDKLASQSPKTMMLYKWVQNDIAWATTEAVYGPMNPFQDPDIIEAFWKFEPGIIVLLLQLLPSVLAKESIQAREKIVEAFMKYFGAKGHEKGSALVSARYDHSVDYGVSLEDTARFELGGAFAILGNTIPSAFWLLWHIISDTAALEECREELHRLCKVEGDTVTIDITEVKTQCPILLSTLQEVLRVHGTGTSVRLVQQDYMLDNKYLLKKGSTLMIPGPVQHSSREVYGDSVNDFNHKRFIRTGPANRRLNPVGFRGFGGGSTLCPGRHFATTEIIAFAALAVLRFDIKPTSGKWVRPKTTKAGMQATVPWPDTDVEVEVAPRGGELAGKRWNVVLTGSDKAMDLVAEDRGQQ